MASGELVTYRIDRELAERAKMAPRSAPRWGTVNLRAAIGRTMDHASPSCRHTDAPRNRKREVDKEEKGRRGSG